MHFQGILVITRFSNHVSFSIKKKRKQFLFYSLNYYQTTKHMREYEIHWHKINVEMKFCILASCSHRFVHSLSPAFT